jgi:hypothetical protein
MARTKKTTAQNKIQSIKYKEIKKERMNFKKSQFIKDVQTRRDATNQTHTYLKEEGLEVAVALWRMRSDLVETLTIFDELKGRETKVMEDTKSVALFKIPKSDPTLSAVLTAISVMDANNLMRTKDMFLSIIDFIDYNVEESPSIYALEKEKIANAHKVLIMASQSIQSKVQKIEKVTSPVDGQTAFDDAFALAYASGEMAVLTPARPSVVVASGVVLAPSVPVAVQDVLADLGRAGPPKKGDPSTWRSSSDSSTWRSSLSSFWSSGESGWNGSNGSV